MAVADELEQSRAGVIMIHGMPYNAEAPPAALDGDITPTDYHYIRSNFAVPAHEGTLEIGGGGADPNTPPPARPPAVPAGGGAGARARAGGGGRRGPPPP